MPSPKVSYLAVYRDDPHGWTPEQMLRELLSQFERGDIKANKLVVLWNEASEEDPDAIDPSVGLAGCSHLEAVGLMHLASSHIDEAIRGVLVDDES